MERMYHLYQHKEIVDKDCSFKQLKGVNKAADKSDSAEVQPVPLPAESATATPAASASASCTPLSDTGTISAEVSNL